MIVATAGHIDHGKTALVRALTGVQTDRLPEEIRRGMTIDLGFAYMPLADAAAIAFVDVPGHERFIRNMLAGVGAIDYVLLVVSADDGVMPQTREHVAILDLLGVRRGAVVITKVDRVSAERVGVVAGEVRELLSPTGLMGTRDFEVASPTGQGVDALRRALIQAAAECRCNEASHIFRMSVDRAFSVRGAGTVVTGTILSGTVERGGQYTVCPRGTVVRVREVQLRGRASHEAPAGSRCALNLVGLEVADIGRGDWIVDPTLDAPTQRVDVELAVLASEQRPLQHMTRVHLHIGTRDVIARVATSGARQPPGTKAYARLMTETPISAVHGDRFVVRDSGAVRTIGGGRVLDPFPASRQRVSALRTVVLQAHSHTDPETALRDLLSIPGYPVDIETFRRAYALTLEQARAACTSLCAVSLGRTGIAIGLDSYESLKARVMTLLSARTAPNSSVAGRTAADLRLAASSSLAPDAFMGFLERLRDEKLIDIAGARVQLRSRAGVINEEEFEARNAVVALLNDLPIGSCSPRHLADRLHVPQSAVLDLLQKCCIAREVHCITRSLYLTSSTLGNLVRKAAIVAAAKHDGRFSAAEFRTAIGSSRALAIQLLEHFDRMGVTRRSADTRIMLPKHLDFVVHSQDVAPSSGASDAIAAVRS
jgi:selenocysteine-specific elongation factor